MKKEKTKDKKKEEHKKEESFLGASLDRNVYLFDDIEDKTAGDFVKDMNDIMDVLSEEENIIPDIFVHINTIGGDVAHMFAIVDYIEFAKSRGFTVHTIGVGQIMSAGLVILASGSKGFRVAGKNTRLMFHQVRSNLDGEMNTLRNDMKESEYCQERYLKTLMQYSVKNRKFYDTLIEKNCNYYFSADEAIEWGIVDKIL